MDQNQIMQIFEDTAYVRMGGSAEELRAAEYLKAKCAEFGCEATIEAFEVHMATMQKAVLTVDGKQIVCEGYLNAGSWDVES